MLLLTEDGEEELWDSFAVEKPVFIQKKKNVNKVKSKAVSENASTICKEIPLNVICFIKKLIQVLLRLYIVQTLGPVLQARKDDREFQQYSFG